MTSIALKRQSTCNIFYQFTFVTLQLNISN